MRRKDLTQIAVEQGFVTKDFVNFTMLADNRKKFHIFGLNNVYYCPNQHISELISAYRFNLYQKEKKRPTLLGRIFRFAR